MSTPIVVRGQYAGGVFVPSEPLPDAEGPAELLVFPHSPPSKGGTIFDVFGKAKVLRSAEDIAAQLAEERAAWGP